MIINNHTDNPVLRVAIVFTAALILGMTTLLRAESVSTAAPGVVTNEFIFESAPFPSCHASTIAETKKGLVAAWFGGTKEGHPDVGIWLSRQLNGQWLAPVKVATGTGVDGKPAACFNPVLFQSKAELLLFYKTGGNPNGWAAFLKTSANGGETWSEAKPLPAGYVGPVKNKPVRLPDGSLLCGSSIESREKPSKWQVQFERTSDLGKTWTKTGFLNDGIDIAAIQPSILFYPGGRLQALGRTRQGKIFECWSADGGNTWGQMTLTGLPNPNSGTDAVTLCDGRQLLVYNHTDKGRSPLNVALSTDGKHWQSALVLEDEPHKEFSYPAVIQTHDGLVHITYTWKRLRIKHVVLDPEKLMLTPLASFP
jgi:predicted neuraminidase